jgi:hypothetical protein
MTHDVIGSVVGVPTYIITTLVTSASGILRQKSGNGYGQNTIIQEARTYVTEFGVPKGDI